MLFTVFFILHCVLHLNSAREILREYPTQNKIQVQLETAGNVSVCQCTGQKCELHDQAGEEICLAIQKRFRKSGILNPDFVYCQLDQRTCSGTNNASPKILHLNLIGDRYSMETSPIWMGSRSILLIVREIFNHTNFHEDPISYMRLQSAASKIGIYGMPIEFTGVLRYYKEQQINSYHHCVSQECIHDVNRFCADFEQSLRYARLPITGHLIGCHVRRFYMSGGSPRMNWAMLFDYEKLVKSGVMNTFTKLQQIRRDMQHRTIGPGMIRHFFVLKAYPLDFCAIRVKGEATHEYHEDLWNPLALRTRYLVEEHYKSFIEQLMVGDEKCPTCLRKVVGLEFTHTSQKAKVDMDLWVSGSCFKQRGFQSCEEITRAVEKQWRNGQAFVWNEYASNFQFGLVRSGSFMDE